MNVNVSLCVSVCALACVCVTLHLIMAISKTNVDCLYHLRADMMPLTFSAKPHVLLSSCFNFVSACVCLCERVICVCVFVYKLHGIIYRYRYQHPQVMCVFAVNQTNATLYDIMEIMYIFYNNRQMYVSSYGYQGGTWCGNRTSNHKGILENLLPIEVLNKVV